MILMENITRIQAPETKRDLEKIEKFHGYLSSGALIGYQMLQIAKKHLDIQEGDKIYVTSETLNCIMDPFQILLGSTIGNKRLTIKDYDKMAIVVNKASNSNESKVKGIRIYLDHEKTSKYPKLHAWYMNYEKVPHEEVLPILIDAGEDIYSYEFVEVEVPEKKKKNVIICKLCGESFVSKDNNDMCVPCSIKKE
jgi:formylmethanofuran dehydrogenase subunit E